MSSEFDSSIERMDLVLDKLRRTEAVNKHLRSMMKATPKIIFVSLLVSAGAFSPGKSKSAKSQGCGREMLQMVSKAHRSSFCVFPKELP